MERTLRTEACEREDWLLKLTGFRNIPSTTDPTLDAHTVTSKQAPNLPMVPLVRCANETGSGQVGPRATPDNFTTSLRDLRLATTMNDTPEAARGGADIVLRAYFGRAVSPESLSTAIRKLELERDEIEGGYYTALDAAVAAVLLRSKRGELPQWASVSETQETLGRKKNRSAPEQSFVPQHLFTLNWGDSGPGFS